MTYIDTDMIGYRCSKMFEAEDVDVLAEAVKAINKASEIHVSDQISDQALEESYVLRKALACILAEGFRIRSPLLELVDCYVKSYLAKNLSNGGVKND